jgi:hypothetical protein
MQLISQLQQHRTSLSLRATSYRRLCAAMKILERNGIFWSEAELFGRLAEEVLARWRGRGKKSATLRRYNRRLSHRRVINYSQAGRPDSGSRCSVHYVVRPWYVNQVLYSTLWQRTVHSGQSVSRLIDLSVRSVLPRLLEVYLRTAKPDHERSVRNAPYWARRYQNRKKVYGQAVINYSCLTHVNDNRQLVYSHLVEIVPWGSDAIGYTSVFSSKAA